jgi:hypothetical protein
VGPRTGLDNVEKRKFLTLPGLELRPLSRPARSQSLYRLRYPGSSHSGYLAKIFYSVLFTRCILLFGFNAVTFDEKYNL